MEQRELKFKFVIDNKELSGAYSLDDIIKHATTDEEILEAMEPKCDSGTCFTESQNHCDCSPQYDQSEVTGRVQYTGLQDTEGREIYEDDVVSFTYWWFDGAERDSILTGTIVYSNEAMSFQLKGVKNKEWEQFTGYENNTEYLTPFSELNFVDADFQVIGNIRENPELLTA